MLEAAKYIWISNERASDRNCTSERATGIVRRVARSEQARIPTDALSIQQTPRGGVLPVERRAGSRVDGGEQHLRHGARRSYAAVLKGNRTSWW